VDRNKEKIDKKKEEEKKGAGFFGAIPEKGFCSRKSAGKKKSGRGKAVSSIRPGGKKQK